MIYPANDSSMYFSLLRVNTFHLPKIINLVGVICAERKTNIDFGSVFARYWTQIEIFHRWRLLELDCFPKRTAGNRRLVGLFELFDNTSTYRPTKQAPKIRRRSISLTFCNCNRLKGWISVEAPCGILHSWPF